jgi:hypothetical protein
MSLREGFGVCSISTIDLTGVSANSVLNQKMYGSVLSEFNYEKKNKIDYAKGFVNGKIQRVEPYFGEITYSLKVKTEISNWHQTGLSIGQLEKTFTNLTTPRNYRSKVNAAGVATVPGIVAGTAVIASIDNYGPWGQTGAIPIADMTTGPNTVTLPVRYAGATITLLYDQTLAIATGYGGPGAAASLGKMQFFGKLFDNTGTAKSGESLLWMPEIQYQTESSKMEFKGGLITYEVDFLPLVPAGWSDPYLLVDGNSIL